MSSYIIFFVLIKDIKNFIHFNIALFWMTWVFWIQVQVGVTKWSSGSSEREKGPWTTATIIRDRLQSHNLPPGQDKARVNWTERWSTKLPLLWGPIKTGRQKLTFVLAPPSRDIKHSTVFSLVSYTQSAGLDRFRFYFYFPSVSALVFSLWNLIDSWTGTDHRSSCHEINTSPS